MGRCHAASQPQPTPCGSGHLEIVPASGPWRARLRRLLSGPAWRQWIVHPARTRSRRLRATERLPARCPIALMHCPQMCSRHGRLQTACAPGQTSEPATDRRSLVQCRPCSVTKNTSLPQTCCTTLSRHAALVLSREACRRRTVVGDAARRRRGEFALGDVGLVPSAESTQAPSRSSVCTEAFASSASIVSPASVTRQPGLAGDSAPGLAGAAPLGSPSSEAGYFAAASALTPSSHPLAITRKVLGPKDHGVPRRRLNAAAVVPRHSTLHRCACPCSCVRNEHTSRIAVRTCVRTHHARPRASHARTHTHPLGERCSWRRRLGAHMTNDRRALLVSCACACPASCAACGRLPRTAGSRY